MVHDLHAGLAKGGRCTPALHIAVSARPNAHQALLLSHPYVHCPSHPRSGTKCTMVPGPWSQSGPPWARQMRLVAPSCLERRRWPRAGHGTPSCATPWCLDRRRPRLWNQPSCGCRAWMGSSRQGCVLGGQCSRYAVLGCWAAGRCRVNPTLEEASAARILCPDDPGLCGLLNAHTRSAHHAATHSWLQKRVELPNDQASTWCCGGNACTCPTPRCTEGELSDWMPLSPGSGSLPSTCGTWCGPCTSASGPQGTQCPHERHRDGRLIHACAAGRWLLEGCTDS